MNKICPSMPCSAVALLLCIAVMLSSCSYTAKPENIPAIMGFETMSLSGVSVFVTNVEKDSTEYKILTEGRDDSGFRANREAWSRKLVEAMARELARRGAQVRSNAPLKLSLSLQEITFIENKTEYQFKVKVLVASSKEWSKTYEGTAGTSRYKAESVAAEANQLAAEALAEDVKAMLGDFEFLAQLSGKK